MLGADEETSRRTQVSSFNHPLLLSGFLPCAEEEIHIVLVD